MKQKENLPSADKSLYRGPSNFKMFKATHGCKLVDDFPLKQEIFHPQKGRYGKTSNVPEFCRFPIVLKFSKLFIALPNQSLNYVTFENGD